MMMDNIISMSYSIANASLGVFTGYIFLNIQAGARIVIHDPKELPQVAEYGMDITPATYTMTAITEVKICRRMKG